MSTVENSMGLDYFNNIPNVQEFIEETNTKLDELDGNIPDVISGIIRDILIQSNINIKKHIYEAQVEIPIEYRDLVNYEDDRHTQICLNFYDQLRNRLDSCRWESIDIIDSSFIKVTWGGKAKQ